MGHDTFLPVNSHAGYLWTRVSAHIYLDVENFVFAGDCLMGLCVRRRFEEDE